VFNNAGYLDNLTSDFTPCNQGNCVKYTLLNKYYSSLTEQRTVWVNRGWTPRITVGPGTPPPIGPRSQTWSPSISMLWVPGPALPRW
ncbi:MAG: hypothetical protein VX498_01865, partial [Myxococcota bacterium]|nr:hypothetical protein [Myxococcota bacterium]